MLDMNAWIQFWFLPVFRLFSQNGEEFLTPVWFKHCWNSPRMTVSVRAQLRVTKILQEWLFTSRVQDPPQIFFLSAVSFLCPGCDKSAFTQLRFRNSFLILSKIYILTRICWSQIQIRILFPLNPALNPIRLSDLFNLPMFIWSMLLPSLNLLSKEMVMISCDDCTAGVNVFPNN